MKDYKTIVTSVLMGLSGLLLGMAFGSLAKSMAAIFSLMTIVSAIREGHE